MSEIDWSAIETHDGPATRVPTWIEELTASSASVRKNAVSQLSEALNHQGTPTPAAAVALPLLLPLCFDARLKERDRLIMLCVDLACGGSHARWLGRPHAVPGAEALGAVAEELVAALSDRAAGVRAAAALALGFATVTEARTALAARLAREKVEVVRASIVLALGRYSDDLGDEPLDGLAALMRAVVRAWWSSEGFDRWGPPLVDGLSTPAAALPWAYGDVGNLLAEVIAARAAELGSTDLATCLAALRGTWSASRVAARAVHALFPKDHELPHPPRDPRELTEEQTRVLTQLSAETFLNGADGYYALQEHGLPARLEDLRRFLGSETPGALDQRVNDVPAWLWISRELIARQQGRSADAVLTLSTLDEAALLAVATEAARGDYLLLRRWPWSDALQADEYEHAADLGLLLVDVLIAGSNAPALQRLADPFLASPQYDLIRAVLFTTLAELGALPEPYEALFQQGISYTRVLRRGLAQLAPDAQERVLATQPIGHQVQGGRVVAWGLWLYADLAPSAGVVAKVLDAMAQWQDGDAPPAEGERVLRALAAAHPDVVRDWVATHSGAGQRFAAALL
ncbi:MAG: hypothetical protein KC776_16055 [Myxococcales bacterium]|nr:hypothetical protein [Myxococcales bacterium]MCB9579555.1 hypothetical protein [Polyangiaceae bacterium]